MWSVWSEVAVLLVLLAASSPYATVVTGHGILHITEQSASVGGCVLASGRLADLWIGGTTLVAYSSSDSLRLVLANDSGLYVAEYGFDSFLGLGDDGKVITLAGNVIDIAGEEGVDVGHTCTHPISAKLSGGELAAACDNALLYYRIGSSEASLLRVDNITAVLGLGRGTVLVSLRSGVGFVDISGHKLLEFACEPIMWGSGDEGVWVACGGDSVKVFLYSNGSLKYAEVPQPYSVCSSAGDPCEIAESSLYIGELSFSIFGGYVPHDVVQVDNVSVTMRGSVKSSPTYSRVPGNCSMHSSSSLMFTGEPIPSRLLVGSAMIVGGLVFVLLGYRFSKHESIS